MNGIRMDGNPQTPKRLNGLARNQTILRLYQDILTDLQICDIEGWDKKEYIAMLQDLINGIGGGNDRRKAQRKAELDMQRG